MSSPDLLRLVTELGGNPPDAFLGLDTGSINALGAALRNAKVRQKRQVDAALTEALAHVPALLRGTIRRVLGL